MNYSKNKIVLDTDLLKLDLPPLEFAVPGILPKTGLAIVGGAPKAGKSLLMLNLAMALGEGGRFIDALDVQQSVVLYIALEDTLRSLQSKMKKMAPDYAGSGNVNFWTELDRAGADALTALGKCLKKHKKVKIVIIDTMALFSSALTSGEYAHQYKELSDIKKFADSRNILVILIHHLRKTRSADPMEMLYGTNAGPGAADVLWVLQRVRGNNLAKLFVTGREIEDQTLFLGFEKDHLSWIYDDPDTFENLTQEIKDVFFVLYYNGGVMTLDELSKATGFKKPALSKYLDYLRNSGHVEKVSHGKYRSKFSGNPSGNAALPLLLTHC